MSLLFLKKDMKITHLDFTLLNIYYMIQSEVCLIQFNQMALF